MNRCSLFGEGYSYLIPLLLYKKDRGQVHSIFTNGFNIVIDDSLIFIGNEKNGLLPFGIHLQEDDTKLAVSLVENKEWVIWNESTASLEFADLTICLKNAQEFKNQIASLKGDFEFQKGFNSLCSLLIDNGKPTGLDIHIDVFINKHEEDIQNNIDPTLKNVIELIDVAVSSDNSLIEKVLRFLLGRGIGLTPSGDDMIVGLLAFDSIKKFVSAEFYRNLAELLKGVPITTDVSREYLRYALKHEFSSTVTFVINALASGENLEHAFKKLLHVGHSSGLDTLFGILIGMLAYKNSREH